MHVTQLFQSIRFLIMDNTSIDYDFAAIAINQDGSFLAQKDGLWGLYDNDEPENPIVSYSFKTKNKLIEWYFEDMDWNIHVFKIN